MALIHSRQIWPILLMVLGLLVAKELRNRIGDGSFAGADLGGAKVEQLFESQASGMMVQVEGVVERILADDQSGSRHQRFVLRLAGGHTLLVAHNLDLAPRVPLEKGDAVTLSGQYEWNDKGGVVHWTHDDPDGTRTGGWIEHRGQTYR